MMLSHVYVENLFEWAKLAVLIYREAGPQSKPLCVVLSVGGGGNLRIRWNSWHQGLLLIVTRVSHHTCQLAAMILFRWVRLFSSILCASFKHPWCFLKSTCFIECFSATWARCGSVPLCDLLHQPFVLSIIFILVSCICHFNIAMSVFALSHPPSYNPLHNCIPLKMLT